MPRPTILLSMLVIGLACSVTADAATSCYTDNCNATCSPAPAGITTLIGPGNFPVEGDTPIVFADPGDHKDLRLVATQEGLILVWDMATESFRPTPFLDLRDDIGGPVLYDFGERGLLSLALAPDYPSSGLLYVFYTAASTGPGSTGDIVIERYERSAGDPAIGDLGSATTMLVIEHSSASNHNGGHLAFGPDGFLYISTGDGGGSCDSNQGANGDGQVMTTLAGKMLRIDVHGVDGGGTAPDDCSVASGPYTIPTDNPFAGQEPACDEIWTLGLRNPFRFSFDRANGDIYIGDVGQNTWEEINLLRPSMTSSMSPANFGWACREGCDPSSVSPSNCSTTGCPADVGSPNSCEFPRASGFQDPILCHPNNNHSDWVSIMGGFRYRGQGVPSLGTSYIYGDAGCGQIWKTASLNPATPAAITASCWASGYGGTFGFAEDHLGELYVVVGGASRIDCIHDGGGCTWAVSSIFTDGFESGDVSMWSP